MFKIESALRSSPRAHQYQMRTLALLLAGFLALGLTSTHAIPAAPLPYNFGGKDSLHYDRFTLSRFADDRGYHNLNITRDRSPTYGDRSLKGADGRPLLPVTQLELPRFVEASGTLPRWLLMKDRATGYLMTVCTGTGCQYRIPMIWTQPMLDRVAAEMSRVRSSCNPQSAECELAGVERAMTIMEAQFREKLDRMTKSEIHAYMVTDAYHGPFLQDCVDQVYNGTASLMILADAGLMRLFRIYYPGSTWTHNYTRLQAPNGLVIALDLYHRSSGVGTGATVTAARDPLDGAI